MKYTDYVGLFNQYEATFAVLSTFNFDPAFFEARILRSRALESARRVIVFMDGSEYSRLQRAGTTARYINRRYLLVPVKLRTGVFHPKLSLLLSDDVAHVTCGSNNITQPGCIHNLEFTNSLFARSDGQRAPANIDLVRVALKFFSKAAKLATGKTSEIAMRWLDEIPDGIRWLQEESEPTTQSDVQLISSFDGRLWDSIEKRLGGQQPSRVTVVSPFYDADLGLLRRIQKKWPKCKVQLIAQQQTSNLPVGVLGRIGKGTRLHEVTAEKGRRLHAKLIAFHTNRNTLCVAGSANFTTAAFDGRNVETCLTWRQSDDPVSSLFDKEIKCLPIKAKDFEPGFDKAPEDIGSPETDPLVIKEANLQGDGALEGSYSINLPASPDDLSVVLFIPGQALPIWSRVIHKTKTQSFTAKLPEGVFSQIGDLASCTLSGTVNGERIQGLPVWVVQEERLTHDLEGGGGGSEIERKIAETGRGLLEHLEELGARLGMREVIDYLRNLRIRYSEGDADRGSWRRRFRVKGQNPLRSDSMPEWLTAQASEKETLAEVIYDFLDRHERLVLRRHARKGNLNGLPNFMDVFRAMIRLVFTYYRRGVVPEQRLIGWICDWLKICFVESQDDQREPEGYFMSLCENYAGEKALLRSQLEKENVPGHLYAALLVAQMARMASDRKKTGNPAGYLPTWSNRVRKALSAVGVSPPVPNDVVRALETFEICSHEEATAWVSQARP